MQTIPGFETPDKLKKHTPISTSIPASFLRLREPNSMAAFPFTMTPRPGGSTSMPAIPTRWYMAQPARSKPALLYRPVLRCLGTPMNP